ncbi:hypothetical protein ONZ43_g1926 [Nemania bipapillata]|uniref:Uncharacterized protein n=1 Tax=Nemania bipapillata TaxID=110536 RepID=A0ACC2J2J4_9PEZI|nr:hypothetical protein ONZ43_g1926 [Nemania bipapillata]
MSTILLIGATSGIGEAMLRRFHGLGKKVIATGRNRQKLGELAVELKGVETRVMDVCDLPSLPSNVEKILKDFPNLDTVFINAGIQKSFSLFDASQTRAISNTIVHEITTNLTAPNLLVHLFAPYLLQRAKAGKKSNIFVTSSGLAYVPLGDYPTYCATKAGIHALLKGFRQQLLAQGEEASRNMSIVEVVPPWVDTGLDKEHRETLQKEKDMGPPPMPLEEYINKFFENLDQLNPDGSIKPEIGVGYGGLGIQTWRNAFEPMYKHMGLST